MRGGGRIPPAFARFRDLISAVAAALRTISSVWLSKTGETSRNLSIERSLGCKSHDLMLSLGSKNIIHSTSCTEMHALE